MRNRLAPSTKAKICREPRVLAMIVGWDGHTGTKHFTERRIAIEWLEGEGGASFHGKIARFEIYNRRKMLVWSKSFAFI